MAFFLCHPTAVVHVSCEEYIDFYTGHESYVAFGNLN